MLNCVPLDSVLKTSNKFHLFFIERSGVTIQILPALVERDNNTK